MPTPVSILILTYNEEIHLDGLFASIRDWSDDIWVVDCGSSDRTQELARAAGANVAEHAFENYAAQKNWALKTLAFKHEWVLLLDADERVPQDLRDEINDVVSRDGAGFDGYWMRYRLMFYGRWIRHCGWYPTWILRLARRSKISFEERAVDEHPFVDGKTGYLEHDLIHESLRDMEYWIAKHNRYSTLNANIYHDLSRGEGVNRIVPRLFGTQAERKRWLKEKVYARLPGKALAMFLYMYVFRLGFLDGKQGFVFCVMHAIFQEFNVVKIWELEHFKDGAPAGGIRVNEPGK